MSVLKNTDGCVAELLYDENRRAYVLNSCLPLPNECREFSSRYKAMGAASVDDIYSNSYTIDGGVDGTASDGIEYKLLDAIAGQLPESAAIRTAYSRSKKRNITPLRKLVAPICMTSREAEQRKLTLSFLLPADNDLSEELIACGFRKWHSNRRFCQEWAIEDSAAARILCEVFHDRYIDSCQAKCDIQRSC